MPVVGNHVRRYAKEAKPPPPSFAADTEAHKAHIAEDGHYGRDLMSRARRAIVTLDRPHDIRDFPLAVNLYKI